ncbi:hypothetical protein BCF59_0432 [Mycoplasmopsis mustelae]|uniref:Uncharacterized protein n=1 Tax=Mycoplasmopsis mustelae TaxID=171289 RepID=A0A4V6Q6C0_9BACT|nr:hypothetical protein [Mycoplasmopsis mustelae]TDV24460.1 hypothetical protein BCF59_0432 [Mycoplasmopsis mustelae]
MKHKFYIDFEAITVNFLRWYKNKLTNNVSYNEDLPYCYSVGSFFNNEFKSYFQIIDFAQSTPKQIYKHLRRLLLSHLRLLTNDPNFIPNKTNSVFYAWGGDLERAVLSKLFDVEIDSLTDFNIALDKVVPDKIATKSTYFDTLENLKEHYKNKRLIKLIQSGSDGRKACLYGLWFLLSHYNFCDLYKTDKKRILKEIKIYNMDDVYKLAFVETHWTQTQEFINKIISLREQKTLLNNKNSIIVNLITILDESDKEDKINPFIAEFLDQIDTKIKEASDKDNIQNFFKQRTFIKMLGNLSKDKAFLNYIIENMKEYVQKETKQFQEKLAKYNKNTWYKK